MTESDNCALQRCLCQWGGGWLSSPERMSWSKTVYIYFYGSSSTLPNSIPTGRRLLHSAHGFQGRTPLLPHRRRACQLGCGAGESWRGGTGGAGRAHLDPRVGRAAHPARAGSRRLSPGGAFWLSAAPVHARLHVTQTDPGTSVSLGFLLGCVR